MQNNPPDAVGRGPSETAVSLSADRIRSLVDPFEGRQRVFLAALLSGQSRSLAAASAGVTPRTAQYWATKDRGFAKAANEAAQHGFATVIEPELYRRALAGTDDRSSMKALEMIVKQRDPSYREKSQEHMDPANRALEAIARFSPERLGLTPEGRARPELG